jgi:hypothetical protein
MARTTQIAAKLVAGAEPRGSESEATLQAMLTEPTDISGQHALQTPQ